MKPTTTVVILHNLEKGNLENAIKALPACRERYALMFKYERYLAGHYQINLILEELLNLLDLPKYNDFKEVQTTP